MLPSGRINDFKMVTGCTVSGVVVDEAGRAAVPQAAEAQLRKPGRMGSEYPLISEDGP